MVHRVTLVTFNVFRTRPSRRSSNTYGSKYDHFSRIEWGLLIAFYTDGFLRQRTCVRGCLQPGSIRRENGSSFVVVRRRRDVDYELGNRSQWVGIYWESEPRR